LIEECLEALAQYKTLAISTEELQGRCRELFAFEPAVAGHELQVFGRLERSVSVGSKDIEEAIAKYIHGTANEQLLCEWASLLIMGDFYELEEELPRGQTEAILAVLHRLAAPDVYGVVDATAAQEYLLCIAQGRVPEDV